MTCNITVITLLSQLPKQLHDYHCSAEVMGNTAPPPRKTADNTAYSVLGGLSGRSFWKLPITSDGGVGSVVANHRDGSSVVVTIPMGSK